MSLKNEQKHAKKRTEIRQNVYFPPDGFMSAMASCNISQLPGMNITVKIERN
jgi:hypothetical protein